MKQTDKLLTGSTKRLFHEFESLGIECESTGSQPNLFRHRTKNGNWLSVKGMVSQKLPLFSYLLADNKWWAQEYITGLGISMPKTFIYNSDADALALIHRQKQVVVKPNSGAHGNGVSINVSNARQLKQAISRAQAFDSQILLQEQLTGPDIRMLIIGGKLISALERVPATVAGDGFHTVAKLIQIENSQNNQRGVVGIDKFVKIPEAEVNNYLSPAELNSIPTKGVVVRVVGPSNHSLGGSIRDAIKSLDKTTASQAELIAKNLQMPIAGIDCILTEAGAKFIEINASPGIGIHDDGLVGVTSGCFKKYAQLLYQLEP